MSHSLQEEEDNKGLTPTKDDDYGKCLGEKQFLNLFHYFFFIVFELH